MQLSARNQIPARVTGINAGEAIAVPLTATRPAAIQSSASRREASPARAITLAIRSPSSSPCLSASAIALLSRHGRAPRPFGIFSRRRV